jgi:hypothetical protein
MPSAKRKSSLLLESENNKINVVSENEAALSRCHVMTDTPSIPSPCPAAGNKDKVSNGLQSPSNNKQLKTVFKTANASQTYG